MPIIRPAGCASQSPALWRGVRLYTDCVHICTPSAPSAGTGLARTGTNEKKRGGPSGPSAPTRCGRRGGGRTRQRAVCCQLFRGFALDRPHNCVGARWDALGLPFGKEISELRNRCFPAQKGTRSRVTRPLRAPARSPSAPPRPRPRACVQPSLRRTASRRGHSRDPPTPEAQRT